MTQADRKPPLFERGQRLSAAALNALTDAILSIIDRRLGRSIRQPQNLIGVLEGDLYAAVNWLNDPSTATIRIARKNGAGDYEITAETLTVTNRFENISLDAGTVIGVEWIDGEWQPYKADCTPQSESLPGISDGPSIDESLNFPPGGPSSESI